MTKIRIIHGNIHACAKAFNMSVEQLRFRLNNCEEMYLEATCRRLKEQDMVFEVITPDKKLHSGISTFFDQIGKD